VRLVTFTGAPSTQKCLQLALMILIFTFGTCAKGRIGLQCHLLRGQSVSTINAGANQVKFNRISENILASSHDSEVRIWDTRKGSAPAALITAHNSKIYGIDWSRRIESEIVTCSADEKVKFWDYLTPHICRGEIETGAPVWRSRFTPFGDGVITMPQRKDNNLYMWNCAAPNAPVYTFSGHSDTPTEFVWRYQKGAYNGIGLM
jgi:WD40 repeat protein